MKKILILLLMICSVYAGAVTRTVGTGGTYATLALANAAWGAGTFAPGDSLNFKRGETFYGTLVASESGTSGSPIVIGAWGPTNLAKPIITGFVTITGWTNEGGGLYSKAVVCENDITNMVTIDGVNTERGRTPNIGIWSDFESHAAGSITDTQLTGTPDWDNAEVVIRKNDWRIDVGAITNHTTTTITYTDLNSTDATLVDGYGYFIQNDIRTLDQLGEWYYDGDTLFMYFGAVNPVTKVVKVATLTNIIYIEANEYITFDNLILEGSTLNGVNIRNGVNYFTLQNSEVRFAGGAAISNRYFSTPQTYDNNVIHDCNFCAYNTNSDGVTFTNNEVYNIGLIPGSVKFIAGDSYGNYNGITVGSNAVVQYNEFYNIGTSVIGTGGSNVDILNNYIYDFCVIIADMGAIYTHMAYTGVQTDIVIDGNIFDNTNTPVGNVGTTLSNDWVFTSAIYGDWGTTGLTITNNTITGCDGSGIKLGSGYSNIIRNNTFYNNQKGIFFQEYNLDANHTRTNIVKNNIVVAKTATQNPLFIYDGTGNIHLTGTLDSNYYARPIDDNLTIYANKFSDNSYLADGTLAQWQTKSGQDAHSYKSPFAVANVNLILFDYSVTGKTVTGLSGYKSLANVSVTSYTLDPYESIILLYSGASSVPASSLIIPQGKIVKY